MRNLEELNINEGGKPVNIPVPTPEQIAAVEALVGAKLPVAYLSFLRFSNGGCPELDTFYYDSGEWEGEWGINRFFSISSDPYWTEDVLWNYTHLWPGAPHEGTLLPIAGNGGGDVICLDLADSRYGEVVIMYHDPVDTPLIRTGLSFEQMIDQLVTDPDYI